MARMLEHTFPEILNLLRLKDVSLSSFDFKQIESFFIQFNDIPMISEIRRIGENYANDSVDGELFRGSYYIMNDYYMGLVENSVQSAGYDYPEVSIEETARKRNRTEQLNEFQNLQYEKAEGQLAVFRKIQETKIGAGQIAIFIGIATLIIGGLALIGRKG